MSVILSPPFIISCSVFTVVFCMVWVGMNLYRESVARHAVLEKVRKETAPESHLNGVVALDTNGHNPSLLMSLFGRIGNRYAGEESPKYTVLRLEFMRAGIRKRLAVPAFWGVKLTLLVVLPCIFFTFRMALNGFSGPAVVVGVCAGLALLGLYLPDLWLKLMIAQRKTRISRSLPDALDMLVVCVEAGLGLDSAISRVSEEIRLECPDISDELRLYNLEMRAGTAREDALDNLNRRTDLDEIRSLTNLLIQTNRFGTSLAQGLRVYADSFRAKRFSRAEERAATLPTKLMLPVLFFIFPALFVVIALPAAIRIYTAFIAPGS